MSDKKPSGPEWDCYANVKICRLGGGGTHSAGADDPLHELVAVGTTAKLHQAEFLLSAIREANELAKQALIAGEKDDCSILCSFFNKVSTILKEG